MAKQFSPSKRSSATVARPLSPETSVSAIVEPQPGAELTWSDSLDAARRLFAQPLVRICSALVLVAVVWQIFVLGFYLDDWPFIINTAQTGKAFSLARWHAARTESLPRPGLTPLWYFLTSVLGNQTILWHTALLAVNIALVYLLFEIGRALTGDFETRRSDRIIYFSVLFWMILPWNATFHFWPTDVPVLLIQNLFLLCMLVTLRGWVTGRFALVLTLVGYLWACIGYEAVYFQWVPLGAIGLLLVWARRLTLKNFIRGLSPFVIGQAMALAWMSISLRINHDTQNKIVSNWPAVFLWNFRRLPGQLIRSSAETGWIVGAAVLVWGAAATYVYVRSLWAPARRTAALFSIGKVFACLFGAMLSILAFSLGGRTMQGIGVDARSLLGSSIWFVIVAVLVNTFCWSRASRQTLVVMRTAIVVAAAALAIGHLQRAFDWAEAWKDQNRILQEAPISAMKSMEPGAAVFLLNPANVNGAPILAAPWDVNYAMKLTHPAVSSHEFLVYNPWLGLLRWSNGTLAYESLTLSKDRPLYVWIPGTHDFFKADKPFYIDQNASIHGAN